MKKLSVLTLKYHFASNSLVRTGHMVPFLAMRGLDQGSRWSSQNGARAGTLASSGPTPAVVELELGSLPERESVAHTLPASMFLPDGLLQVQKQVYLLCRPD